MPNPACTGNGPSAFPNNPSFASDPNAGTNFTFTLSGTAGTFWTILASTNFVDWTSIGGAALNGVSGGVSGFTYFTDSGIAGLTHRFYQARSATTCSQIVRLCPPNHPPRNQPRCQPPVPGQ